MTTLEADDTRAAEAAGSGSPPPDAVRLAVLLSPACRIEPELVRTMRLTVMPWLNVGAEADLWFSDWVATRSLESITLLPDVLTGLRQELGSLIRDKPAGHPVHAVWPVLQARHATMSPALCVEERVTWLAITAPDRERRANADAVAEASADAEIELALQPALRALVDEGRTGIADWYAGAWQRFPESVRRTKTGWQLAQVVISQLPHLAGRMAAPPPAGLTSADVAAVLESVGDVRIPVLHDGRRLSIGAAPAPGAVAIEVPDTRPRLLELEWTSDGRTRTEPVAIAPDGTAEFSVGASPVRLRTARGTVYVVAPPQPAPRSGGARRLGRLLGRRGAAANPVIEPLIKTIRARHRDADTAIVERAYEVAAHWHRDQRRESGDPYITHPLAVATILAELGLNTETICAALLRHAVARTAYTLAELREEFGSEIAALVEGVAKLDTITYGESAEAETIRKMVVAMSRDARVLVIKLAGRLHDMRTVRYLARAAQESTARETLEIYAPVARRLGLNTVAAELEDLGFVTLYPRRYDEVARLVALRAPRRDELLREVTADLEADLREAGIKATVTGRPKHYYSVYQKMIRKNAGIDDIYDLVGVRVLVDSVRNCYAALGMVHARWNPVPGRFKDYIAMPKFNMFQAVITTVTGPGGTPVEIQIQTEGMHRRAEYGVSRRTPDTPSAAGTPPAAATPPAAGTKTGAQAGGENIAWLRTLINWQRGTEPPAEFLDSLRSDLAGSEIYVFTPKGDVITLPLDATPVDFAYTVHTDVGHRTIGARVNGRLAVLDSVLQTGDTVEIFTSKAENAGPSRDWLRFVKSARARACIRVWFARARTAGAASPSDQEPPASPPGPAAPGRGVIVEGATGIATRLSGCCGPVPGDEITGYVTRGRGVSVHRADCANLRHMAQARPDRLVTVRWTDATGRSE